MKVEIDVVELFSGIGGFSLGLQKAGFKIKRHQFSEINKYAIANYKYNFKNAEHIGSVEDVRGKRGQADIVTFGSPCQDFSLAGKRKGLEGKRSSLITEAIRLVDEIRPSVFIWENVKGTFSSNDGADFWAILKAFTNLGGYRFEWQLLNTSWFLPQNRERIYLVGHLDGRSFPRVFPIQETDFRTIEGESNSPTVRAFTAGGNSGGHHSGMTLVKNLQGKDISNTIRSGGRGSLTKKHNWDMIEVKPVLTPDRKEKRQNGRRIKEDGEPVFTLNCQDQHGVLIQKKDTVGNSQGARIYKTGGISSTLNSGGGGLGAKTGLYEPGLGIRRLTEIECERLQGFPDNWTQFGDFDGKIKEISKTQRYTITGNAVTVDVVEEIGKRLIAN